MLSNLVGYKLVYSNIDYFELNHIKKVMNTKPIEALEKEIIELMEDKLLNHVKSLIEFDEKMQQKGLQLRPKLQELLKYRIKMEMATIEILKSFVFKCKSFQQFISIFPSYRAKIKIFDPTYI